MIEFSNGHQMEYAVASGALGFDGLGWPWERPLRWIGLLDETLFTTVLKTITLKPRQGNTKWYDPRIRFLPNGVLNAMNLPNPGAEWWCSEIGPKINSVRAPVLGSIFGEPEELEAMAMMLNPYRLVGLEIDASCPNTGDDLLMNTEKIIEGCKLVQAITHFPLTLKLSVSHEVGKIVPATEGLVQAYSINSVPWHVVFPEKGSPLASLGGGGVSGKLAQPFTWKLVEELVKATTVPIIGPSVWEYDDIEKLRLIGAKVSSFGSIFLRYPLRPTLFVRRDMESRRGKTI